MPTPGTQEALYKLPPGAADIATASNRPFSSAFGGTGLAVTPVTVISLTDAAQIPPPPFGCYITWCSDTDCYVRVGTSTMNIATTSDAFLPAGATVEWWHRGGVDTHFSVIQKTAGGTIKRWRSSL